MSGVTCPRCNTIISGSDSQEWIDELGRFIMDECPGYPDRSEGAVECAIRIIKDLRARIK